MTFCHSCGTMSPTMSGRAVAGCRPSAERNGTEPRLPSPGWVGLCTLFSRDDGTPSPQGPGAVRLAGRPLPAVWRAGIVLDKTVADHPGLGGPRFFAPWGSRRQNRKESLPNEDENDTMEIRLPPGGPGAGGVTTGQPRGAVCPHLVAGGGDCLPRGAGGGGAGGLPAHDPAQPPGGGGGGPVEPEGSVHHRRPGHGRGGPGVCRPAGPVCPAPLDRADPAGPAGGGQHLPAASSPSSPSWCRRTSWSGPTAGCSCSTAGPSSWGR